MAKYQGFNINHVAETFSESGKVNTDCMSIDLENQGQQTAVISIKDSNVTFSVGAGESIRFPASGNQNPLIKLSDWYTLKFTGAGTKKLVSTKCYATPSELNF